MNDISYLLYKPYTNHRTDKKYKKYNKWELEQKKLFEKFVNGE